MYIPDFEYYSPDSTAEACQMLSQFGARAKVLAGGTDILSKLKTFSPIAPAQMVCPEIMVSLKNLEQLKKIEYVPGKGVVIGALSTHNHLVNSEVLNNKYMSISEAAHQMANNQIRHRGTIGGNLINAVPSADLPPILIALNATVKLVSSDGERIIPLEELFLGVCSTCCVETEILTEVIIPDQKMTGSNYIKFGARRSGALAIAGVAVAVEVANNVLKDVRIVSGAVAITPLRAKKAEDFLKGKEISTELLEEAGVIASGECKPITDIRASAEYRTDLVRILTKRALRKAIDQGHV